MKIAICLSGHMRTYERCVQSLQRFFGEHEVDYFIHTWADQRGPVYPGRSWYSEMPLDVNKVISLYKPKKICVEWDYEIKTDTYDGFEKSAPIERVVNMYRKIYLAHKLLEEYIKETGVQYDLVVRTRSDIYFFYPTFIPVELKENDILLMFVKWGFTDRPTASDTFAAGTLKSMQLYCSLYEKLLKYSSMPMQPEMLLGEHFNRIGLNRVFMQPLYCYGFPDTEKFKEIWESRYNGEEFYWNQIYGIIRSGAAGWENICYQCRRLAIFTKFDSILNICDECRSK